MSRKIAPFILDNDILTRLKKYAPVEIALSVAHLPTSEQHALLKLIEAASYMNSIYWRQISEDGLKLKEKLKAGDKWSNNGMLRLLTINFGPWDVLDNNHPFAGAGKKPEGCNFYPKDLTRDEFTAYLENHPDLEAEFGKSTTLIRRRKDRLLVAIPYERAYRNELKAASVALIKASRITQNVSLARYLSTRAADLVKGDFNESDRAWLNMQENLIDIVIGPTEVYDDKLLGLKASYEGAVLVKDLESTAEVKYFEKHALDLERNLPIPREYQKEKVRIEAPIEVFQIVYASGMANAGSKAIAATLPNDERIKEEVGTKQLIYKNILLAKFKKIVWPISEELIAHDQLQYVKSDAFLTSTLLHELSHALGLNYIRSDQETSKTTVHMALKDSYSTIDEAKADIVGLYNLPFFQRLGVLTKNQVMECYVTYLAGALRTIRFGLSSDHARANMLSLSHFVSQKAILFDRKTEKYRVDFDRIEDAIKNLAARLLLIEGDGNYNQARALIDAAIQWDGWIKQFMPRVQDVPIDLEFVFAPEVQRLTGP